MGQFVLSGLRSVELGVRDLAAQADFYTRVWGLSVVARGESAVYLRGTGAAHHILALHRRPATALLSVSFSAPGRAELDALAARLSGDPGRLVSAPAPLDEPGGGHALTLQDPEGRRYRVIAGDAVHRDAGSVADMPQRLAHVVLNAPDVARASAFLIEQLGFRITDRTRMMNFLRTNSDHHSIAFANLPNCALNHIAFLMPDLESVMRGTGRLRDAGHSIEWGVGRHGPGHNVFAYFLDPEGLPIEYTGEVETVDDSYRVGSPEDWTWPPGRIDHWGLSAPPSERLKLAQSRFVFA
jgi:catechol 2,3-dioxygenase